MKYAKRFNELNASRQSVAFKLPVPYSFTKFDKELRIQLAMNCFVDDDGENIVYDEGDQKYHIRVCVYTKIEETFIRIHEWYMLDPRKDLRPQFGVINDIRRVLCGKVRAVEDLFDAEVKTRV